MDNRSNSSTFFKARGIFNSGEDLCEDRLPEHCLQGFVTETRRTVDNETESLSYLFNSVIESVRDASFGTIRQLSNCITYEKVGDAVVDALQQVGNGTVVKGCTASGEYAGARVSSGIKEFADQDLPAGACDAYKSSFPNIVDKCADDGMSFAYNLGLGVAITVSICALALVIYGCCSAKRWCEQYSPNCCDKKEEDVEAPAAPTPN